MEQTELEEILKNHKKWLNGEGGERADFRFANLVGADFSGADLREADLFNANLVGADFRGADLRGTDFRGADLCRANFRGADLRRSTLEHYYITGGTRNDSALYIPQQNTIYAGCQILNVYQFFIRCKNKKSLEHKLYIEQLLIILKYRRIKNENITKQS